MRVGDGSLKGLLWVLNILLSIRFILLTNATRLLSKANTVVLNTLVTLQNDYLDSKAIKNVKINQFSKFNFLFWRRLRIFSCATVAWGEWWRWSNQQRGWWGKDRGHWTFEKCKLKVLAAHAGGGRAGQGRDTPGDQSPPFSHHWTNTLVGHQSHTTLYSL